MKLHLIYPKWPKLERQTEFHLPPHGPVVFAAALPEEVEIVFTDENRETLDFDAPADLIALSVMLTCQLPRAFEIARKFRQAGKKVIFGGIATTLHAEEVRQHADCVFIGEAEGRMAAVLSDFQNGRLQPVYDYLRNPPDIRLIGTARRDILKKELYTYRGMQMLDLTHASRGCRFNCFPCCTGYLGGRKFRPRPIDKVMAEMAAIDNNRLFIVDNSLAQDREWLKELFTAMIPLKKKWVSHPILDDDEILDLAAKAGCWYVYQAIFNTSDVIRQRVQRLKDRGIGVEGTIILGTDDQSEDDIKRLIDFLLEIKLDVAEFTILTPFPHSPIRESLDRQGRLFNHHWLDYTADKVVFKPAKMSPEKLQELFYYAWDTFYADSAQPIKMGELLMKVMQKEMADGTLRRHNPRLRRSFAVGGNHA